MVRSALGSLFCLPCCSSAWRGDLAKRRLLCQAPPGMSSTSLFPDASEAHTNPSGWGPDYY
eukprot:9350102-Pyramimonas_sp.AAC.1